MSFGGGGGGGAVDEKIRLGEEQNELFRRQQMFSEKMAERQQDYLETSFEPYRKAGFGGLQELQKLLTNEGSGDFLNEYFQSPMFNEQSQAARLQQESAAEATGNLGSSSLRNAIGSNAPRLGGEALNSRLQGLQLITGLGGPGRSGVSPPSTGAPQPNVGAFGHLKSQGFDDRATLENQEAGGLPALLGNLAGFSKLAGLF